MKRIMTFDFLRGLAIFLMTLFHSFQNVYDMNTIYNMDLTELNPVLLVFGGVFFVFGHSRSTFLFLSAIINQYNISIWLQKGRSPHKMLQKNIFKGILVYIFGMIREGFFNPWTSVIYKWLAGSTYSWSSWQMAYLFETLQVIGLSIIFLSVLNYFLALTKLSRFSVINCIFLFLGGIVIIFVSPTVHEVISAHLGYNITSGGIPMMAFTHWMEYFTRLFWMSLGGQEEPIFPNFGLVCIGAVIGMILTHPKKPKYFLTIGHQVANLMIISGVLYLVFIDKMVFDFNFRIQPTWFALANTGLDIHIVFLFLGIYEFKSVSLFFGLVRLSPKSDLEKYKKHTRFFRRWALVAMTLYFIQFADIFPRRLLTFLTGNEYTIRMQLNLYSAILTMLISALFFDILIRLWEKVHFILTWEWLLVNINRLVTGKRHVSTSRINVKESLYDAVPVDFYLTPVVSQEIVE